MDNPQPLATIDVFADLPFIQTPFEVLAYLCYSDSTMHVLVLSAVNETLIDCTFNHNDSLFSTLQVSHSIKNCETVNCDITSMIIWVLSCHIITNKTILSDKNGVACIWLHLYHMALPPIIIANTAMLSR